MKISWINIGDRLEHELRQLAEEGADVATFVREWESIKAKRVPDAEFRNAADELYRRIEREFPPARAFPAEPSSWMEASKLSRVTPEPVPTFSPEVLGNNILGGWLGRAAGCLLGKPVEKIQRDGIRKLLQSNGTWPLNDFITERGIPANLLKEFSWNRHSGRESLKENIVCMPEDDDMDYPMLNLHIVEMHGSAFEAETVARTWLTMLPVCSTFTAERVAYVNALSGLLPPGTASYRNPYREWIGAQIRADLWGWTSPAQPARAAELAWRDAGVSHVRNGIYGEAYFAALIALSFEHRDLRESINLALQFVPPESRFARAIRFVLSIPVETTEWEETVNRLYAEFGSYHWVHTINNAALVTAALLSAGNDYGKAVCNVVMGGWDTDSNGATVGSVMGTILGADRLPRRWIDPLHDRIRTSLKGFDNASFSDLARRTLRVTHFHSTKSPH